MTSRSAISNDWFADQHHRETIDKLGDPLQRLEQWIDFKALALQVDQAVPRPDASRGGRPAYPTNAMVRLLIIKQLGTSKVNFNYRFLEGVINQRVTINTMGVLIHQTYISYRFFEVPTTTFHHKKVKILYVTEGYC